MHQASQHGRLCCICTAGDGRPNRGRSRDPPDRPRHRPSGKGPTGAAAERRDKVSTSTWEGGPGATDSIHFDPDALQPVAAAPAERARSPVGAQTA
jgi:hypothetical protein